MFGDWPSSQYSPQTVLVSHILHSYSSFRASPLDHRIRVRFLFEQFLSRVIDVGTFWQMLSHLDHQVLPAANIAVTVVTNPLILQPEAPSRWWSDDETCILLFGYFSGSGDLVREALPHRPKKYWAKHAAHVIAQLEGADVLTESVCHAAVAEEACQQIREMSEDSTALVEELRYQLQLSRKRVKQCTAKLMRKTRVFWKRLQALRAKNASLSKKVQQLEKCLVELASENNDEQDPTEQILASASLTETLLGECNHINSLQSSKHVYSDLLRDIGQLIASTSPKTYRILRRILPLPSVSCLHSHYGDMVSATKNQIKEEAMIHERVRASVESGSNGMISSLCIDAFAVRTFTGGCSLGGTGTDESKYSNVFLFMEVPLDSNYPVRVLYLQPKNNGSFDRNVEARAQTIKEMFQKEGHSIWFQATDGDPYLNRVQKAFHKKYLSGKTKHDFCVSIEKIHDALIQGKTMPIADPLHFTKNIRGKLIDHDVAVTLCRSDTDDKACTVNARLLEEHLNLGQALTDVSQDWSHEGYICYQDFYLG